VEEKLMAMSDAEVRQAVVGADKLVEVYGWATPFHDTVVDQVVIDRVGPTITMRLRTNEMCVIEGREKPDVLTWATLRWTDVHDLRFSGLDWDENNWIWGMQFKREGELIRTELEPMDGFHGFILSGRVEVASVEVIPEGAPSLHES
jgi:hypothetical protein